MENNKRSIFDCTKLFNDAEPTKKDSLEFKEDLIQTAKDVIRKCAVDKKEVEEIKKNYDSDEKFLKDTMTERNWKELSTYQLLSETFMDTFKEHLDWGRVCAWQKMSPEFIQNHIKYMDVSSLKMNPNIDKDDLDDIKEKKENVSEVGKISKKKEEAMKLAEKYTEIVRTCNPENYRDEENSLDKQISDIANDILNHNTESLMKIVNDLEDYKEDYADIKDIETVNQINRLLLKVKPKTLKRPKTCLGQMMAKNDKTVNNKSRDIEK